MIDSEQAFIGWDRNLDYEFEKTRLEQLVRETRDQKTKAFYAFALVQLVNLSRVGEAVEAMLVYAETGEKRVRVRVEKYKLVTKSGKEKKPVKRLMKIPETVRRYPHLRDVVLSMGEYYLSLKKAVGDQIQRYLGYNSHALRHCSISHYVKLGYTYVQIASITKQANPATLMRYVNQKEGEAILEEMVV